MVVTLACDRRTTTCCSPTPGPSPATVVVVLGGADFAGEGGNGFCFATQGIHLRWLPWARIEIPFRDCSCVGASRWASSSWINVPSLCRSTGCAGDCSCVTALSSVESSVGLRRFTGSGGVVICG